MQGPHDFYVQTKLRAVLIKAELAANARVEEQADPKSSWWARLRQLTTLAGLRPVARRV